VHGTNTITQKNSLLTTSTLTQICRCFGLSKKDSLTGNVRHQSYCNKKQNKRLYLCKPRRRVGEARR